jgi:hypothetical protein
MDVVPLDTGSAAIALQRSMSVTHAACAGSTGNGGTSHAFIA